jgi:hypothetical protein
MSKSLATRIDRLEGRFGWRFALIRDRHGREMSFDGGALVDAAIEVALTGVLPATFPRRAWLFLAGAHLRPRRDGDFMFVLRDACQARARGDREVTA